MTQYKYSEKYLKEKLRQKKNIHLLSRKKIGYKKVDFELSKHEQIWLSELQNKYRYIIQLEIPD